MSVQSLTAVQVQAAVYQILDTPKFRPLNPHLTAAEIAGIRAGVWPLLKPVFSPYANNHDGYTSGEWTRIYHRISANQFDSEGRRNQVPYASYYIPVTLLRPRRPQH